MPFFLDPSLLGFACRVLFLIELDPVSAKGGEDIAHQLFESAFGCLIFQFGLTGGLLLA